ncbi:MAG: Cytochrome c oxidase subunit [Bacteroidota bacterium]
MSTTNTNTMRNQRMQELKGAERKAAKPLLYIAMVSIVMLFSGLTSAYIVRADNGNWLVFDLPKALFVSTGLVICSSIALLFAQFAIRRQHVWILNLGLWSAFGLGIGFVFSQMESWHQLTQMGIYFIGKQSNASGSFLYLLALVHLLHLLGGLIALLVTAINSLRGKYSAESHLGFSLCVIYWHFLTLLWIYLFLFLYFYR